MPKRNDFNNPIAAEESRIMQGILEQDAKNIRKSLETTEKLIKESQDKIFELKSRGDAQQARIEQEALKNLQKSNAQLQAEYDKKIKIETRSAEQIDQIRKKAHKAALIGQQNKFNSMSVEEKLKFAEGYENYVSAAKQPLIDNKAALQKKFDSINSMLSDGKHRNASYVKGKQTQAANLKKQIDDLTLQEYTLDAESDMFTKSAKAANRNKLIKTLGSSKARTDALKGVVSNNMSKAAEAQSNLEKLELEWDKNNAKRKAAIRLAEEQGDHEKVKRLKEEEKAAHKAWKAQDKYKEAVKDTAKAQGTALAAALGNIANDFVNKAFSSVDSNLDSLYKNQAKWNARLQGTDENWKDMVKDVYQSVGYSGIVSTKGVVDKMSHLIDSGISYNIELRAFLSEVSSDIASTFNATNGTLLRLIRLQQADTTAARLGMEATLTELFNRMFEDASYLADNVNESVSAALLDATANMGKNMGVEFEYVVQKWLGSLYSIGMSSSAIESIAQGLNALGSGNYSSFDNSSLMTLFGLASAKSGKPFADLLKEGLDAETTNDLLRSMVELLTEITHNSADNVVKYAWSSVLGMSPTDLKTFSELRSSEIQSLYNSNATYSSLVDETETQIKEIWSRKHLTQIVDTIMGNAMTGVAVTMGNNPAIYALWKAIGMLESSGIDEILVPGIPNMDLLNIAKVGIQGMGLIGSLVGAVASLAQGGPSNLDQWNFREYTKRGAIIPRLSTGTASGTSMSESLALSGSGSDIETVTLQQAVDMRNSYDSVVSDELEVEDNIYDALVDDGDEKIIDVTQDIRSLLKQVLYGETDESFSVTGSESGAGSSSGGMVGAATSRIYDLLSSSLVSGDEALITVVQGMSDIVDSKLQILTETIDKHLNQERVFYTSIVGTGANGGTSATVSSGSVSSLYSSLIANHVWGTTINNRSQFEYIDSNGRLMNTSGAKTSNGSINNVDQNVELGAVIAAAVEAALRNIAGYSSGNGLPVVVTNMNMYGG